MAKAIQSTLEFTYYDEGNFPLSKHHCSGIYIVYSGYYTDARLLRRLAKLLYIGEADNVLDKFNNDHKNRPEWIKELEKRQRLFFGFADVKPELRKITTAALIYHYQPCCNKQNKDSFKYKKIINVFIDGETGFLDEYFTVHPTKVK
jgi:hypothetical protein